MFKDEKQKIIQHIEFVTNLNNIRNYLYGKYFIYIRDNVSQDI